MGFSTTGKTLQSSPTPSTPHASYVAAPPSKTPSTSSMGFGTTSYQPDVRSGTPSMGYGTPSMRFGTPSMGSGTLSMGFGAPSLAPDGIASASYQRLPTP